jgi:hypothetical protein
MAVEIVVGPMRQLSAAGRFFAGERAGIEVVSATAPAKLYVLDAERRPVAACVSFEAADEGRYAGSLELATEEVAAAVEGVRAGKVLPMVAVCEDAGGSQIALGVVALVASAMPGDLQPLPPDIIDPFVRRAAIRALAAGLSTGGGTQREVRAAVDTLLSRLAAFGLCLALAAARPAAAATEWQDVPPDTAVEVDALTNTPAAVAAQIAAATNAIPPPNPPEPIYAHPAPWTVAVEYATGAGSGVATNGDVLMTTSASGAYLDYEISARGEPRPAPWAYDPPMVSVEIISDPAGAVASIDSSGAVVVVRASGVQGVALAQVTGGDGAIRDIPLTFSSAGIRVADAWAGDVPGSFRAHCSASTGALFGWISTNDCVAVPGHDAPVPADLFIYRYDAAGAATNAVFADGFIALVSQIFCLSAQKNDTPAVTNGIAISPIGDLYRIQYLAVSEHYAITADHMAPYGRGVDARWYDGSQFIDRGAHHDVGRRGDLRVVRFGVGVPQQCWARFGAVSLLGRLSPTEFSHSVGITLNQHGYVSTTSLSVDATYGASFRRCGVLHGREWTMGDASFGRPQVEAAYHAPHAGDSGHIVFFVLWDASDSLRLVPAVCLSTAETGTDLTDPETLAWIKSTVEWHSGGVETIQFWREEDFE